MNKEVIFVSFSKLCFPEIMNKTTSNTYSKVDRQSRHLKISDELLMHFGTFGNVRSGFINDSCEIRLQIML